MKLSREDVLHIARLARLGVTDTDVERFQEQLSNILDNFTALQEVDTTNIPPTAQSITLQNVMKSDEEDASLLPGQIMANAPQRDGDFFKMKAVLEE